MALPCVGGRSSRDRSRLRLRLAPAALAAASALTLAFAPTAGAAEVGVNVAGTSGDPLGAPGVIGAIRAAQPAWVRVFVGWNGIEPARGSFNSAEIRTYQRFFAQLPAGTRVDVDVEGTPAWAAGGSSDPGTPPVDDATFAGFVDYLANAFGSRVGAWEIWNEEDSTAWWTGTPAQYAALLRAADAAIKSVAPRATVLIGGLTGNDVAYLDALYAAGAQGAFDGVAVHTDTACNVTSPAVFEFNAGTRTINQYFFLGFTAIHAAMIAAGDGAKPIYMTEIGWSSTRAECETGAWAGRKAAGVDQPTQAAYLEQAYHCLALPRYSYVKAAIWFELSDNGSSATDPLDNFGLLNADGTAKPALAAFERIAHGGDPLSGPCGAAAPRRRQTSGDATAGRPRIRIGRPALVGRRRRSGGVDLAVTASAPGTGVRALTIAVGRSRRVTFRLRAFPRTVSCTIAWRRPRGRRRHGPRRVRVVVTDRRGGVLATTFSLSARAASGGGGGRARAAAARPGRCRSDPPPRSRRHD